MESTSLESKRVYTPAELAGILRVAKQTVYNRLSTGKGLPDHFRVGSRVRFRGSDIISFIEKQIEQ